MIRPPSTPLTDAQVIDRCEVLMRAMANLGLPTQTMQRFFDVGEWLLCFEGAWVLVEADPLHPIGRDPAFKALAAHFADELGTPSR